MDSLRLPPGGRLAVTTGPARRPAAALAGGLFLLLAGVQHLTRSHRNGEENVAMVSDLAIGVLMLGYVAWAWT